MAIIVFSTIGFAISLTFIFIVSKLKHLIYRVLYYVDSSKSINTPASESTESVAFVSYLNCFCPGSSYFLMCFNFSKPL